jgi:ditrans,polycis-polyprenyl diphosphate synthase
MSELISQEVIEPTPKLTWLQRFLVNVVKTGKIPKSVAIIMDGNRRYAVAKNQEKHKGHI